MIQSVENILVQISVIQLISFAWILFGIRRGRSCNRYLGWYFLISGITQGLNLVMQFRNTGTTDGFSHGISILNAILCFYAPLLLFHVRSLLRGGALIRAMQVHFIPNTLYFVYAVSFSLGLQFYEIHVSVFVTLVFYIQGVFYAGWAMRAILRASYEEIEKSPLKQREIRWWLLTFLASIIVKSLYFLILYSLLVSRTIGLRWFEMLTLVGIAFILAIYNVLAVIAIRRTPQLFVEDLKTATSNLPKSVNPETANKLNLLMDKEAPHLDAELDLSGLSKKVGVHPRTLSLVLKHSFNMSFFDYVNLYRVRHAQRLLLSNSGRHKNITEILFESGFNSKSVFNTAFKKVTGLTPTQFRKKNFPEENVA